jgi:hypothetical protein
MINIDNYLADLSDLALEIQEFESWRDRLGDLADPQLTARLNDITRIVKNLAVSYTDVIEEAYSQSKDFVLLP